MLISTVFILLNTGVIKSCLLDAFTGYIIDALRRNKEKSSFNNGFLLQDFRAGFFYSRNDMVSIRVTRDDRWSRDEFVTVILQLSAVTQRSKIADINVQRSVVLIQDG